MLGSGAPLLCLANNLEIYEKRIRGVGDEGSTVKREVDRYIFTERQGTFWREVIIGTLCL